MNGGTSNLDDKYMYEFCTKRCTWKDCPKDVTCFDAHSKAMSRRVPRQLKSLGGLFNYIPEHCPQYKWKKRCKLGDSCFRAHGWLEVIFHPLLYKTKLCKSIHENGVCRLYGIYCAKAHKRSEMRNLAKIYGKNWKAHYDISHREVMMRSLNGFIAKPSKKLNKHSKLCPRTGVSPNSRTKELKSEGSLDVGDNPLGSSSFRSPIQSITVSESSESLPSQTSVLSPLDFTIFRTNCGEENVSNYIDLYEKTNTDEKSRNDNKVQSLSLDSSTRTASKVKRFSNISSNCNPLYSDEYMDTVNSLAYLEESIASMFRTNWNILGGTGKERAYRRKLLRHALGRKIGRRRGA